MNRQSIEERWPTDVCEIHKDLHRVEPLYIFTALIGQAVVSRQASQWVIRSA